MYQHILRGHKRITAYEMREVMAQELAEATTPKLKRAVARRARDVWVPLLLEVIEILEKEAKGSSTNT